MVHIFRELIVKWESGHGNAGVGIARELDISGGGRKEGRIFTVLFEDERGEEMASLSLVQRGGPQFAKRQGLCSTLLGEVERASPLSTFARDLGEGLNQMRGIIFK